jgi:uncharacterized protein (TIGR02118 family)
MIRATAFYRNQPDARFDFDYCAHKHFPMVMARIGEFGALRFQVEKGLAMSDGGAPEFVATSAVRFKDMDGLQRGLAMHGAEIMGDAVNYTNLNPRLQIGAII